MDIVVLADAYLDDLWLSRHHVPVALAKRHRVLYVERPPNLIKPDTVKRWFPRERLRQSHGMWVYSPWPRLPFDHRWRWLSRLNQRWLGGQVRRAVRKLGWQDPALISFDHKAQSIIAGWGAGKTVYYCVDDITRFGWPFADAETVAADERDTARAADLVVVTAERLKQKLLPVARRVEILPHGVQLAWWQGELAPPRDRPRAVFIGKIAGWVDLGLVEQLAEALPDWEVVMIGPLETAQALPQRPNLRWEGPVPPDELASHLRQGDVGLVPFVINPLTESVLPLKVYEYLAAGLAVVATPLPELRRLSPWVACAEAGDAFVEAVRQADSAGEDRRRWAQAQSWEARARQLEEWLCASS